MALFNFICSDLKTPYNNWAEILKPYLQCGNVKPLQLILRHVMLRRLKRTALENLPGITHHILQVPLTSTTQKYYDTHFHNFLNSFKDKKPVGQQKEKTFFAHLQNLRGICDHPLLADPYLNFSDDGENFTQTQSQNFPE